MRSSSHVRGGIPQVHQRPNGDRCSEMENLLNTPSRTHYNPSNGPLSASGKGQGRYLQSYINSTNNRTPNYSVVGNANYHLSSQLHQSQDHGTQFEMMGSDNIDDEIILKK